MRSCPLSEFAPLALIPGVRLFNLNPTIEFKADVATMEAFGIVDLGSN